VGSASGTNAGGGRWQVPPEGEAPGWTAGPLDVFHLEDGKVSAFDCHHARTILLGQLGVLGNLETALKK